MVLGHAQEHIVGVVGDGVCQVDNVAGVAVQHLSLGLVLGALQGACGDDLVEHLEGFLLVAVHNLVCTGVVGVEMVDLILGVEVVLQVGVGQEVAVHIADHLAHEAEGIHPAALQGMLSLTDGELVDGSGQDLLQLGQVVLTGLLIQDLGEPAIVVQTKVAGLQIVNGLAQDLCVDAHNADGHIADVDDAVVTGEDTLGGFSHDGSGVGVVQHPSLGSVLTDVTDDVAHGGDGAHAVGKAAGAAGLLADAVVLQSNLLIHFTHLQTTGTDLHKCKVNTGESHLRIGGFYDLALGIVLPHQDLAVAGNLALTLGLVIVEGDLLDGEALLLTHQHLEDAGGVAGTCTNDTDSKLLVIHVGTSCLPNALAN